MRGESRDGAVLEPTAKSDEHGGALTMSQAARRLPGQPDPSTIFRWSRRGVLAADGQRVYLRLVRVGRRVFVTPEELERFIERLTVADERRHKPAAVDRATSQAIARAGLAAVGIG